MRKLEVFFDYACPYCLTGHEYLKEILPEHTDVEVVWKPCEAHPRPEVYKRYSDLCVAGYFYAAEQGADLWDFHDRMYRAALKDGVNIEDPAELANYFKGLLDPDLFRDALSSDKYKQAVLDANDCTYNQSGVWFVPAFRMDGKKLDSEGGKGITKEQLAEFLKDSL
jgi:predicted DsbA family dithiol-disulfide isomerase